MGKFRARLRRRSSPSSRSSSFCCCWARASAPVRRPHRRARRPLPTCRPATRLARRTPILLPPAGSSRSSSASTRSQDLAEWEALWLAILRRPHLRLSGRAGKPRSSDPAPRAPSRLSAASLTPTSAHIAPRLYADSLIPHTADGLQALVGRVGGARERPLDLDDTLPAAAPSPARWATWAPSPTRLARPRCKSPSRTPTSAAAADAAVPPPRSTRATPTSSACVASFVGNVFCRVRLRAGAARALAHCSASRPSAPPSTRSARLLRRTLFMRLQRRGCIMGGIISWIAGGAARRRRRRRAAEAARSKPTPRRRRRQRGLLGGIGCFDLARRRRAPSSTAVFTCDAGGEAPILMPRARRPGRSVCDPAAAPAFCEQIRTRMPIVAVRRLGSWRRGRPRCRRGVLRRGRAAVRDHRLQCRGQAPPPRVVVRADAVARRSTPRGVVDRLGHREGADFKLPAAFFKDDENLLIDACVPRAQSCGRRWPPRVGREWRRSAGSASSPSTACAPRSRRPVRRRELC